MNTNSPIVHRDKLLVRNKVSIQCLLRFFGFKSNYFFSHAIFYKLILILNIPFLCFNTFSTSLKRWEFTSTTYSITSKSLQEQLNDISPVLNWIKPIFKF